MAYDDNLAARIRAQLISREGYDEKKMFGGIGFLLHGNMACGVLADRLVIRVGPERYRQALARPGVILFDITGRPMTGWVQVTPVAWQDPEQFADWVELGAAYALSLPAK